MSNLGVFGGTFDPPHIGHLILAHCAYEQFNLEKVLFIPAGKQPHKLDQPVTGNIHRLNMLKLAVADDSRFDISEMEMNRDEISYTYITLKRIKKLYPQDQLYFIIGGDNILDIASWMKPDEIFKLATVISASRPEFKFEGKYKDKVKLFDMPPIGVSSTLLREYSKKSKSIKYLVPKKVENYIIENKLYV